MVDTSTKELTDQAAEIRSEILRCAHDLFCHYGFNKTNIGDIAKCCNMSPGNLYRYYRNKQAIGLAAVQQYFDAAEAAMETELLLSEGDAEDRIRRFLTTGIRHIVDELRRNPKMVELAEFLCEDEQGLKILDAHISWKRELMARELQKGMSDGVLAPRDPERTASTVLNGLKMFWMPMTLARWRDPSTIMPELEELLDLMFRGLRT